MTFEKKLNCLLCVDPLYFIADLRVATFRSKYGDWNFFSDLFK